MNFNGYVRTVEDANVIFQRTAESEAALLQLQSIHACWIRDEVDQQTGLERLILITAAYVQSEAPAFSASMFLLERLLRSAILRSPEITSF